MSNGISQLFEVASSKIHGKLLLFIRFIQLFDAYYLSLKLGLKMLRGTLFTGSSLRVRAFSLSERFSHCV